MLILPDDKRSRAIILREYMTRERLSTRGAARQYSVSQTTVRRWLNPELYPAHEGRESRRRYAKTDKAKAYQKKYQQSDKGRDLKGRSRRKNYAIIEKRVKLLLATQKVWAIKNDVQPCTTPVEDIAAAYRDTCPLCMLEGRKMVIDHNHDTGEFRGWICRQCNMCLGMIQEDSVTLQRMKDYLQ